MSFTNYLEGQLVDHTFGGATFTKPTSLYLALYVTSITENGVGTEVSSAGTGYTRQLATFDVTVGDPTNATNNIVIEYPIALADYGTITHVAIHDAQTAGNMLAYAALNDPKTILSDDVFRIAIGNLNINLD